MAVPGAAGHGQSGPVQGGGLLPVSAAAQEVTYRGGDLDGVQGVSAGGGVAGRGVQVGVLGFQPGRRLPDCGQVRCALAENAGSGADRQTPRTLEWWLRSEVVRRGLLGWELPGRPVGRCGP